MRTYKTYSADPLRGGGKRPFPPRRWLRILAVSAMVPAIAAGVFLARAWLFQTDLFCLSRVEIHGNRHVGQDLILSAGNLRAGLNLLALDARAVGRDIESLEWVRRARVAKELPDTLKIWVEEFEPVALVNGKDLYLVDGDGEIFRKVEERETWDLPIITGVSQGDIDAGRLPGHAMSALKLIRLAESGTRTLGVNNISEIHLGEKGMVVYTLDRGIALHMDPDHLERQFARAEKVLLHLYSSGLYKKVGKVDLDYAPGRAWACLK